MENVTVNVNVKRRGVSNETKAVAQLKFNENDAMKNNLFVGHLEEIRVDYSVGNDTNKAFVGLTVPRLTLHFCSNHDDKNIVRHVYKTLFPVESNTDTIPGGKSEWQVDSLLIWIKHILDIYYLKGREMTDAEQSLLSLNFIDFDEQGQYVQVEQQDVLNAYETLFKNVVAMLDGKYDELKEGETPKCHYKDANGKYIPVWMKLLRHIRTKNGWSNVMPNGDLGFSTFVGTGALEVIKTNMPPQRLRFEAYKESIVPQEIKKQPTIPGAMPMMGSITMPNITSEIPVDNTAFTEAGVGNMPF